MTRLCIDDQVSDIGERPAGKLGDVLQEVTSQLPPNRIVTRIVLDGRELPKYDEADALEGSLEEIQELGIRTVDRELWAARGLDIALSSLERMQRTLLRAAEMFREQRITEANRFFVHCLEGLEKFLETVVITRCALGLDFSKIRVEGGSLSQVEKNFSKIMKAILVSQKASDADGIADRIEYELLTNVRAWMDALKNLKIAQANA